MAMITEFILIFPSEARSGLLLGGFCPASPQIIFYLLKAILLPAIRLTNQKEIPFIAGSVMTPC